MQSFLGRFNLSARLPTKILARHCQKLTLRQHRASHLLQESRRVMNARLLRHVLQPAAETRYSNGLSVPRSRTCWE